VLKRAPEQTLRRLKDVVRRAQHRLDPASAEQRTQRAREDRRVRVADVSLLPERPPQQRQVTSESGTDSHTMD